MVTLVANIHHPPGFAPLSAMFEARKRVFVDLLKWNVPVVGDRYEVDQFDDEHAVYLVAGDARGHAASARLLKTTRPHILDSLFPQLCAGPVPRAPDTLEITRFCLDPRQSAFERLTQRNILVSALVRYALDNSIRAFTGVAEIGWLQQILAFGWECEPLGLPRRCDGRMVGALRIRISPETPSLLARAGIWRAGTLHPPHFIQAA